MFIIYCITCTKNNKVYIGQTNNLEQRVRLHKYCLNNNKHPNKLLQWDFNLYGCNSFTFSVLDTANTRTESLQLETKYMNLYGGIESDNIYNQQDLTGPNESVKQKISESVSGSNNGFYGKHHTEEFKQKHSKRMTGNNNPAKRAEVRNKISIANKGHKTPEHVKQLISRRQFGENNSAKSLQARKKISESHRGKPSPRKGFREYSEELAYKLKQDYMELGSYKLVSEKYPELSTWTITHIIKDY